MSDAASGRPGRPLSKTAYVLERLRAELADGTIPAGEQLRQVEIAQRYGVSPTPVREALRLLEADGAIQYSPHRGATVSELSPVELSDLYRVRTALETTLAQLAAERATPEQVAEIRRLHEDLAARQGTDDPETLSRLNAEFHLAIMRIGSPMITRQVVAPLWKGFLPPSGSQWLSPERNERFVSEHAFIVSALEAGKPEVAAAAMSDHLHTAMRYRESEAEARQS